MKYGIIVTDMTIDEAQSFLNNLNPSAQVTTFAQPTPGNLPPVDDVKEDDDADGIDATGETDSNGLPWDERIHASSKKQNKDGTWKSRRGVDDDTVKAVEAELRAKVQTANAAPVATAVAAPMTTPPMPTPAMPAPAAAPTIPTMPEAQPTATAPVQQPPMPAPAAAPTEAPTAPVVPEIKPERNFQGLMLQISKLFRTEQIAPDFPQTLVGDINNAFQSTVSQLTDIADDTQKVEYAWRLLEHYGKAA